MTIREQCAKYHLLGKKPHIHLREGYFDEYKPRIIFHIMEKPINTICYMKFEFKEDNWLEESESNTETN